MADTEISRLTAMPANEVQATDPLAIADISQTTTKKVSVEALFTAGATYIADGSIDPIKINWGR